MLFVITFRQLFFCPTYVLHPIFHAFRTRETRLYRAIVPNYIQTPFSLYLFLLYVILLLSLHFKFRLYGVIHPRSRTLHATTVHTSHINYPHIIFDSAKPYVLRYFSSHFTLGTTVSNLNPFSLDRSNSRYLLCSLHSLFVLVNL